MEAEADFALRRGFSNRKHLVKHMTVWKTKKWGWGNGQGRRIHYEMQCEAFGSRKDLGTEMRNRGLRMKRRMKMRSAERRECGMGGRCIRQCPR